VIAAVLANPIGIVAAAAVSAAVVTGLSGGKLGQILKAAVIAGAQALAFYEVGSFTSPALAAADPAVQLGGYVANIAGHAAVGCVSAVASGGQCGPGALSAGVSDAAAPLVGGIAQGNALIGGALSGGIGGLASVAGGGKFADGAVTGAFGYLFNEFAHSGTSGLASVSLGFVPLGDAFGNTYYHAFVELVGPDGQTYYIRGGPESVGSVAVASSDASNGGPIEGSGYGNLTISYGDDARRIDVPNATWYVSFGTTNLSFSDARAALEAFGHAVDAAQIPYNPFSQNSNSFAFQAVTTLGLPRPVSGVIGVPWSPGSATYLNTR
jgi:hypothetical protein